MHSAVCCLLALLSALHSAASSHKGPGPEQPSDVHLSCITLQRMYITRQTRPNQKLANMLFNVLKKGRRKEKRISNEKDDQ